jgi:hypothetical protein
MTKKLALKTEISKVLACTLADRARSIIDSPYTKQIIEQLPPQESYLIIKESWGTDSQILLQYVPPEAVFHFIDLDCWERDSFSADSFMEWLWEIYNASFESFAQALETLDIEILVLLFQAYIEVVRVRPTDEHIPDLIDEGFESLDNMYFYRIIQEDDRSHFIKEMLSILFTNYHDLYYSILEGVMCELRSSMEETTYERRSLRLMEMGFPLPDEAISVYQHVRPEKLLDQGIIKEKTPIITKHLHMLPAVYLEQFSQGRGLLVRSLQKTSPETKERFLYEMIYLANKIIMADFKPLNEMQELKHSMEKASSLVTLGLSVAMKEKGVTADAVLSSMNAETLFSLGYNMVYVQQRRLKLLLNSIEATMIPERLKSYTEGLLKKRPLFKDKEFSLLEELDEVTHAIDTIETMAGIMSALEWEDQIPNLFGTNTGANFDMEAVILTSLAINTLDHRSKFRPLIRTELITFLSRATRRKGVHRIAASTFMKDLERYLSRLNSNPDQASTADIASSLMFRMEEEIGGLKDLDQLDQRFISCFIVKLKD